MKKTALKLLIGISILVFISPISAAVIDFNSVPLSTPLNGYSEQGVTFTKTHTTGSINLNDITPNYTRAMYIGGNTHVKATFDAPANSVSLDMGDFGGVDEDKIFLEIFDAADNSLGFTEFLIAKYYYGGMKTLSLSASNIAYAIFGYDFNVGRGGILADNFTFELAPVSEVPIPPALVLFLPALFGLFRLRQKS